MYKNVDEFLEHRKTESTLNPFSGVHRQTHTSPGGRPCSLPASARCRRVWLHSKQTVPNHVPQSTCIPPVPVLGRIHRNRSSQGSPQPSVYTRVWALSSRQRLSRLEATTLLTICISVSMQLDTASATAALACARQANESRVGSLNNS